MVNILELDFSTLCDIGQQRENNEDYTAVFVPGKKEIDKQQRSGSLFIIADGVGGAARGELASKYAAETVIYEYYRNQELPPEERLKKTYQKANREIYNYAEQNFSRMATTMVAAVVLQNQLIVANVGDSRAYLIRGGKIEQISQDHTIGAELKRNGSLREGEAATEKAENTLTRSIGGEAGVIVDIFKRIPLQLGDKILLCSDGLNKGASDAELLKLSENGTPEEITDRMFRHTLRKGSKDNIALILMETVEKSGMKQKKKYMFKKKRPLDLPELQASETERPLAAVKPRKQRKYVPVLLGLGAITVLASLGWALIQSNVVRLDVREIFFRKIIEELTPDATEESSSPTDGVSGTEEQESASSITGEMDLAPLPTKTFEEDPSAYEWNCLYQFTEEGIYVGRALGKFGIDWKIENTYKGHTSCDIDENGFVVNCSTPPIEYTNEDDFSVDLSWWIHVSSNPPDNWKPEDCTNNGGHIQILNPIPQTEDEAGESPQPENPGACIGKGLKNDIKVHKDPGEEEPTYEWTLALDDEVELKGWDTNYAWISIRKLDTNQVGWVKSKDIDRDPNCPLTQIK